VEFLSNHAGGISAEFPQDSRWWRRFAVKPTSSILTHVETIDVAFTIIPPHTKGGTIHCVGIRAVPVGEAMMACVLAIICIMHRAQLGNNDEEIILCSFGHCLLFIIAALAAPYFIRTETIKKSHRKKSSRRRIENLP